MEKTLRGVTLRKNEYRDNTAIVTLFTPSFGIISVTAYGIHSTKKGVASALQTFTYSEFTLSERDGKYTLKSAELIESFDRLSSSYDELCRTAKLCRAAMAIFSEPSDSMGDAFELFYTVLSFTAYSDSDPEDLYIAFLLHAFSLSGQCPAVTHCSVCERELLCDRHMRFSPEDGGAVCSAGCSTKGVHVAPVFLEAMRRILSLPVRELNKVKLPKELQKSLSAQLDYYLRFWYLK